jgi:5-methylcytosine-specific restriction endonuclease McrA
VDYTPSQVINRMRHGLRLLFDPEPSEEERKLAFQYFHDSCAYCGTTGLRLHLDHLVASSERYGHNHISNRVPACPHCNANEKREMPWREFLELKWKGDPARIAPLAQKIEVWVKAWEATRGGRSSCWTSLRRNSLE